MACDQQTLLLISTYADGEASAEESQEARTHLEGCAECRKLLEDWRGQRTMFEWAYSLRLPEEVSVQAEESAMSNTERTRRFPFRLGIRWSWAGVAALSAAAVAAVLVIHHLAGPPPMLGSRLATSLKPQAVRMESGIELNVGPDTKITRIGVNSIRLDQGWVSASVRHGSGFRVLTRRIEVTDQGTRFTVGTGPKLDYVVVNEGSVEVRKGVVKCTVSPGRALVAQDEGAPQVASLPQVRPGDVGIPFNQKQPTFVPRIAGELDWDEGLQRLAVKFPHARVLGGDRSSMVAPAWKNNGLEYRFSHAADSGLIGGIGARFAEVAQAMVGQTIGHGEWELPVGIITAATSELPSDVHYIRLVPKDGNVVWRLNGSRGGQVDFPLETSSEESKWPLGANSHRFFYEGGHERVQETLVVTAWPWKVKPALKLRLIASEKPKGEQALIADATRAVSGIQGVDMEHGNTNVLYLDQARRRRLLIAWNGEAGRQLYRASDSARQGRDGSAILAVVATDVALHEPNAPAGVYLLRLVLPAASQSPHLEIQAVGSTRAGVAAYMLPKTKLRLDNSVQRGWTPKSLPGYGTVTLQYTSCRLDDHSFPILFQITGRPDDRSTREIVRALPGGGKSVGRRIPTGTWAEGWIRVNQP
ncbi:MAG: zf-HC2 domain-containing protein [Armatimonadota bacterium]|nr:zf-HC2 domain-containing protein [Armatimonadota bacterium]